MNLTRNFSDGEFFVAGKSGRVTDAQRERARRLCETVLQPLRDKLAAPIKITSGKRSKAHNTRVGGSPTSDHLYLGESAAADFTCSELVRAYLWLADNKREQVGQAIYYPNRHFIHVSLPTKRHSGELLICEAGEYRVADKCELCKLREGLSDA